MASLMRKKYLYDKAKKEREFLCLFYQSIDDKPSRKTAKNIQSIDDITLQEYLDDYVSYK